MLADLSNGKSQMTVRISSYLVFFVIICVVCSSRSNADDAAEFEVATFAADVTPPIGHPLLAGWRAPTESIKDRLSARGFVLLIKDGRPFVLVSIDWCELRNDAYDRWRDVLAEATGTDRQRVLVTCIHQHDAPYADLEAQRLLDEQGLKNAMFDPEFHETCVQRTANAIRESLKSKRRVTHLGVGQAKVEGVASNRRVQLEGSPPRFNRYSMTRDLKVRNAPEGEIDPYLKTLSFWDGEKPLVAIHCYATHPMSYYGRGAVSYDFPGMARERRQRDDKSVFQIYMSGCSGDVTAAKFNDGTHDGRIELANRLYQGMVAAWKATERIELTKTDFRVAPLRLKPENDRNLTIEKQRKTLSDKTATPKARSQAALGLSWHKRCETGQEIDVPVIDFGAAQCMVLPAESFVGYQLAAQKMRPDSFVIVAGYGECAPGYIPTAKTREEGFVKEHRYCWIALGEEALMLKAIRDALLGSRNKEPAK